MPLPTIFSFDGPTRLALSFLEPVRNGALQYPTAKWNRFIWYDAIQRHEPEVKHRYADGRERLEVQFIFICNNAILGRVWLEGLRPAGGDDDTIAWAVSAFSYAPTWDGSAWVDTDEHFGRTLRPRDHAVL
jgi:hypothetical protein